MPSAPAAAPRPGGPHENPAAYRDDPTAVIIGVGGLGCPAILGLLGAGVRRFVLVDHDRVSRSNLQRQVLFREASEGTLKVDAAAGFIATRAPHITVRREPTPLPARACATRLREVVGGHHAPSVVLECTDSPAMKFAVNDACLQLQVPAIIGGVVGWTGRVMTVRPGHACYRCYFEAPPPSALAPSCDAVGVMGSAAGVVGAIMAAHAVAALTGTDPPPRGPAPAHDAAGRLTAIDLRTLAPRHLGALPRPGCPACAPGDAAPRDAAPRDPSSAREPS